MYNKLFSKILDSSIWLEPDPTRLVWITLLAAMDQDGYAHFSAVQNLADRAKVSLEKTQSAIEKLTAPDPESGLQSHEGRRIERVPGGFVILNAGHYRDIITREIQRDNTRERVRRHRQRKAESDSQKLCNADVTPSDTDTETNTDKTIAPQSRRERPKDQIWDALLESCGLTGTTPTKSERNAWNAATKQLRDIAASPDEIRRRAKLYREHWPSVNITPTALARHWNECTQPAGKKPDKLRLTGERDYQSGVAAFHNGEK